MLEADPETKYIVLIARKSADNVKPKLLERIQACRKPCIVFFMDCTRSEIESLGAIYTANLDDCAEQCLKLVGKSCRFETDEALWTMAKEAVAGMNDMQKYVRGAFSGGTYMDEAMHTMEPLIGDIFSNAPLREKLRLADSYVSRYNTCIDYGEEELTLGTTADFQNIDVQRQTLREAGALCVSTNCRAARLAGMIVKLKKEKDA